MHDFFDFDFLLAVEVTAEDRKKISTENVCNDKHVGKRQPCHNLPLPGSRMGRKSCECSRP